MIYTEFFIIFIVIVLNAVFSLGEIAIVSASRPMLKHLSKQGNKKAQAALDLAENPGYFLSTVQIGITLSSIFAGVYGGAAFEDRLAPYLNQFDLINPHGDTLALGIVVTTVTYLTVVVGELIPKQLAFAHPEKLAMAMAGTMNLAAKIMYPIVIVLEFSANIIMKVLGVIADVETKVSDEEFKAILTEGAETGVIEKSEHEMLQRVIRLDDRDVKSIMTHRTEVVFIDVNDTIEDIRRKVHETGHSRYPVIDGAPDELKGIVQSKDLLDSALNHGELDIMKHVRDMMILPESASCLQALESFKKHHINLIVVVDEYGSTQGIVTSSDILEAIVGIIPSNYDKDDQMKIIQRADGSWLVDGRTPIEEIHLSIGLQQISADEDFDTIAGFMLEHLRKTPKEGVQFDEFGYRFEIVDMDGHRIDKLMITKLEAATEEAA